ncbi:hypothetical protein E4T47_07285 [Aureobasidium subglaciale]|nr:hypothetical protein E4T47_07285 [Aureobasidium subglaciale]
MAEEVFGGRRGQSMEQKIRRRRGNHFASFTKKFSLGNGPPEWVQDFSSDDRVGHGNSIHGCVVLGVDS